jgi:hypothetical protein
MDAPTDPLSRAHPRPIWLAARFLFPLSERHPDEPAWGDAAKWFLLWGLLIGIIYAGVFRVGWRCFGEYQYIRFVPMALVLAADLGFCGYRLVWAAATVVSRRHNEGSIVLPVTLAVLMTVLIIAMLKYAVLLSIPMGIPKPSIGGIWDWRQRLRILYPQPIYRPLILMPLWGRWAMMLAMSIGRAAPTSPPRLQRMAAGLRLSVIMLYWLVCATLTTFYAPGSSGQIARGIMISMVIMVAAYGASFVLARCHDGQTESAVGATGLLAELVYLALYLPAASPIYWY